MAPLCHILGWLLAAGGFGLLVHGLFADRSRGRPRCPKCWYSMEGVAHAAFPHTCPECGSVSLTSKALHRTRRHLRWMPVSLILVTMGYTVWAVPRVVAEGWTGWVPTTVLLATVADPMTDPDAALNHSVEQLQAALNARVDRRFMTPFQKRLISWGARTRFWVAGRAGVDLETRAIIRKLSATTLPALEETCNAEDILAAIHDSTGIAHRYVGNDAPGWALAQRRIALPVPAERTASAALDGMFRYADDNPQLRSYTWTVEGGSIVIYSADDDSLSRLVEYDVSDLAAVDPADYLYPPSTSPIHEASPPVRTHDLSALVTNMIDPAGWVENGGGRSRVYLIGTSLLVVAPSTVHVAIEELLAALRAPLSAGQELTPDLAQSSRIWAQLSDTVVTVGGDDPGEMLRSIGQQCGVKIEIDHNGWARRGIRLRKTLVEPTRASGIDATCRVVEAWLNTAHTIPWSYELDVSPRGLLIRPRSDEHEWDVTIVHDVSDMAQLAAHANVHGPAGPAREAAMVDLCQLLAEFAPSTSLIADEAIEPLFSPFGSLVVISGPRSVQVWAAGQLQRLRRAQIQADAWRLPHADFQRVPSVDPEPAINPASRP